MKENEFKCAKCKNIYEKGWSDEESLKEMEENFGEVPENEREVICDDCYNYMIGQITPKEYQEIMKAKSIIDLLTN